ncbi:hypothetical protein [Peribacillus sp. NPDC097895]|uniref:hypothetical protein n=1 Tax=Peribacillus sp. NPDC097895 TaxID=3390619 RepID=UPI003D0731EB
MNDCKIGNFQREQCAKQAVLQEKLVGMVFAYINDEYIEKGGKDESPTTQICW